MAVRKPARRESTAARKRAPDVFTRRLSAIVGGVLIGATLAWFGWLLVRQHNPSMATITFPFPVMQQSQPTAQPTIDPLAAAGVTLATPAQGQTGLLSQQQALVLAGQMEPQAAAHAANVNATYTLFSYKGNATTAGMQNVPAWLVHYSKVAEVSPDTASDPHATNPPHDCYLFLNANSGQELLALWT